MRAATVVEVLQDLFYLLLQLLVVAAIMLSFKFYCKFYCMFYFTCDRSLTRYLEKAFDGFLIGAFWDREEGFRFWVKRSKFKVKVTVEYNNWKQHFEGAAYSTGHLPLRCDFLVCEFE